MTAVPWPATVLIPDAAIPVAPEDIPDCFPFDAPSMAPEPACPVLQSAVGELLFGVDTEDAAFGVNVVRDPSGACGFTLYPYLRLPLPAAFACFDLDAGTIDIDYVECTVTDCPWPAPLCSSIQTTTPDPGACASRLDFNLCLSVLPFDAQLTCRVWNGIQYEYCWEEIRANGVGGWFLPPGGRTSSNTGRVAYEVNEIPVPLLIHGEPTRVWMRPDRLQRSMTFFCPSVCFVGDTSTDTITSTVTDTGTLPPVDTTTDTPTGTTTDTIPDTTTDTTTDTGTTTDFPITTTTDTIDGVIPTCCCPNLLPLILYGRTTGCAGCAGPYEFVWDDILGGWVGPILGRCDPSSGDQSVLRCVSIDDVCQWELGTGSDAECPAGAAGGTAMATSSSCDPFSVTFPIVYGGPAAAGCCDGPGTITFTVT